MLATKERMTAAEFFQLPETTQPTELIEGELIVSPSPITVHQRFIGNLFVLLRSLIPNGEVFLAPLDVYLDAANVPQPDIMWVAEGSRCKVGEKRLEGPPDLIVEVLSAGTARADRGKKFQLYERHGVREYWLADPEGEYFEIFRLEDGRFVRQGAYGIEDGSFESAVLGGKTVELKRLFGGTSESKS